MARGASCTVSTISPLVRQSSQNFPNESPPTSFWRFNAWV